MLAALAFAFSQSHTPQQALKLAVACGSGTAMHAGTRLFSTNDIAILSDQISVQNLNI